jgi:hypothetical protein
MKLRPTTGLEWEVEDESNVIVTARPPRRDAFHYHSSKMWRRWRLIVCTGTLLLLASFVGIARLVAQAERNIAKTEREIELAVEADSLLRDPAALKPHIQTIELQNDLAIVHISADESVLSEGRPVPDGTIFYRQSVRGWERVEPKEPDVTVRGPYRYQETVHLLVQYHEVDQSLVEAVVPAIEAFTTDLHRDIGLDQSPAHEKVTVRIAIVAAPQPVDPFELVGYVKRDSDGIIVLSPQLFRGSTTLATADILSQALKPTVTHRTILLAMEEYQPQAVWRPLVDGLQLWAYSTHREFDSDLAKNMNNVLRQQLANTMPPRLAVLSIVPPPLNDTEETPDIRWQQSVLAKSVVDYVIATYGRRSLARLFDGMHQYDSWQSLIPAVFSVSREEFESGWQAYLATRYNLSP